MGNGYDHHSIHHHHHFHQKTIFLPMFCRLSINDITLSNHRKNPISGDDEPSSPKVSCMGQVKRNNRVTGFPSATVSGSTHYNRYSTLKKLFSSKNLLPPTTSSMCATASGGATIYAASGGGNSRSKSCRSGREVCERNLRRLKLKNDDDKCGRDCVKAANIGELDPPLPVVKRVAPPGLVRDEMNLWRRRFNGAAALKGLQIEQIRNLPNSNIIISQPPTV